MPHSVAHRKAGRGANTAGDTKSPEAEPKATDTAKVHWGFHLTRHSQQLTSTERRPDAASIGLGPDMRSYVT